MSPAPSQVPIDVLVVARWYPSVLEPGRGRFVADQAAALAATGRVRPTVASFETVPLLGDGPVRAGQRAVVRRLTDRSVRERGDAVTPRAHPVMGDVPTARLPFALDPPRGRPDGQQGDHEADALRAFGAHWQRSDGAPALVHAHTGYPDGFAAAAYAEGAGLPLVVTEHSSFLDSQLARAGQRARFEQAMERAARIVVVSDAFAAEMRERVPAHADRLVVIPNAVRFDDFRLAGRAGRTRGELLYVGYRLATKGIETLLGAFAAVHAALPASRLRLIGGVRNPADDERWRRLAVELGIADAVSFEGQVDRAAVAEAMARADLLVHASPRETFGVVAVEALASGLPVVAAASEGLQEILGRHRAELGALVPPQDPNALAGAILACLDRREGFEPKVMRDAVESRYSERVVAARLVELYEQVLAEVGDSRPRSSARSTPGRDAPVPARAATAGRHSPERETIVVGLDRETAATALARLPNEVRRRIGVITAREPRRAALPDGFASVAEVDIERDWREALGGSAPRRFRTRSGQVRWAVRHPLAAIRRVRHRSSRDAMIAEAAQALVGAALGGRSGDRPLDLVCLSGLDYLAVEPSLGPRTGVAPGGIAWLADRLLAERSSLDEAQRAGA